MIAPDGDDFGCGGECPCYCDTKAYSDDNDSEDEDEGFDGCDGECCQCDEDELLVVDRERQLAKGDELYKAIKGAEAGTTIEVAVECDLSHYSFVEVDTSLRLIGAAGGRIWTTNALEVRSQSETGPSASEARITTYGVGTSQPCDPVLGFFDADNSQKQKEIRRGSQ